MHRLILPCAILILTMISDSRSALRVRYCVPRYHEVSSGGVKVQGSRHGDSEFRSTRFFESAIAPGVWEGWNSRCSYDSASHTTTPGPLVDAEFWIDSVFEEPSSGAFVSNIIGKRADSTKPISNEGYVVYIAGGIRFPASGRWTIISGGDDGGTIAAVDVNVDGRFDSTETVGRVQETSNSIVSMKLPFTDERAWTKLRFLMLDSIEAGTYYRFTARYYNYSGASYSGLLWARGKEEHASVIPAWAFGMRRNFGAPVPQIASIKIGSESVERQNWPFIALEGKTTVTFTIEAPEIPGTSPVFLWTMGDGTTLETPLPTVTHVYSPGCFVPLVQARWGKRLSGYTSDCIAVFVDGQRKPGAAGGRR